MAASRHGSVGLTLVLGAIFTALCLQSPICGQSTTFKVDKIDYTIDRYPKTPSATKRPAVVLVHGIDGMDGQSGKQISDFAEQLEKAGFLVVVPHYFNQGDGSSSTPLPDLISMRLANRNDYLPRVAKAIEFALEQSDADKDRLGLVGFSLGGGLALEYAESAPKDAVKAVVDYFGYIPEQGIFENADKLPPTLVFHNEKDGVVPIKTSEDLVVALKTAKVSHDHKFYNNGDEERLYHPFTPGGVADDDSRTKTVDWLKTHLK
jgi:dienelactone hydrolase